MRRSVCLLTNAYPDFPESNRVVFIRTLARLLRRENWEVSVLAPRVFRESKRLEHEGDVEIERFGSFLGDRLLIQYPRTPMLRLFGYMASGMVSTIRCILRKRIDVIHAHWVVPAGLIAVTAGALCRKPVIVTAHGSDITLIPRRNQWMRRLVKYVLNRSDAITSVAEHLSAEVESLGVDRERILTFPMSVALDSFCPEGRVREEFNDKRIVFSNRSLYPLYDVESLIRAAPTIIADMPDTDIVLAGEGSEAASLRALAKNLGIDTRVRFAGAVPHREMPEYLRGSTVYVSTSLSDGASVSLLEAMACGTFPVVADIPANREWITDGENGFLFAPQDTNELAARIRQALQDPEIRDRAREVNIGIVRERCDWIANVKKLTGLYERVIGEHG